MIAMSETCIVCGGNHGVGMQCPDTVAMADTHDDVSRMKDYVEGPHSRTALTLSGPMTPRDITDAFETAYRSIQETDAPPRRPDECN